MLLSRVSLIDRLKTKGWTFASEQRHKLWFYDFELAREKSTET